MGRITILIWLLLCSSIQSYAKKGGITEEDVYQAQIASFYAQFNQLFYTKFIFKAAFEEADHLSKTNDQLLSFANFQMSSIATAYESLDIDLKQDLEQMSSNKPSKMTIDALDSLCVANKFIEKYAKLKNQSDHPQSEDSKALSNEALAFQIQIEEVIKKIDSPLDDIECKKLL